jgi:hypothetical protein
MKRMNFFMRIEDVKQLAGLGKSKGLKVSQLVRIAVQEYVRRERRKK